MFEVLNVAVTGDMNEHDLNQVARRVVDDLVELPGISRATISGQRLQEISIEASSDKLESYNLSFQDLADAIRRFSIDLPAGSIDSPSGTFIVAHVWYKRTQHKILPRFRSAQTTVLKFAWVT